MRRKTTDLSYKKRTSSIIDQHFDPWQLTRRDPREGVHKLVNSLVSIVQEMDTEASYIERMFMPDAMDLSEPWVMYHSYPEYPLDSLYISGELASDTVTEVTNVDEFLFGDIDSLAYEYTISGVPYAESILASSMDLLYLMGSGQVTEYDLQDSEVIKSGEIDVTRTVYRTFYADVNHPVFPIRDNFRSDSISVTLSGQTVPFELQMAEDMTGVWVDEFDVNLDSYIGEYEQGAVASAIGMTQQQVSPSVWAMYDWMDVNKDGTISESDYRAVSLSVPSAAPDVTAVVIVPRGVVGAVDISYNIEYPITKGLYRRGSPYSRHTDLDTLYDFATKVAYDSHTDVYYGINSDGTELRAYKYEPDNDAVVNDLLVHVPRWDHACTLVDLDIMDGYLFVLATDGDISKMYYGDIWGETTWEISTEADIPYLSGQVPTTMTTTQDGYFAVTVGSELSVFSQNRDKAIDVDGIGYFNSEHDLELEDGTSLKTIPSYIFNSFDSFAHSALGVTRPWGCDNLQMRRIITDFWKHSQGNDKLGMNFGLMREFGYENDDTTISGTVYHLPAELTYSGTPGNETWDLYMNDRSATVTDLSVPQYTGDINPWGLITNGGFEEVIVSGTWDIDAAAPDGTTLTRSSAYSKSGDYSLEFYDPGGAMTTAAYTHQVSVSPGEVYYSAMSVYDTGSASKNKVWGVMDWDNEETLPDGVSTLLDGQWVDMEFYFTVPDGCYNISLFVMPHFCDVSETTTYWDNVTLYESGTVLETYELVNPDYVDYTSGETHLISSDIGTAQLIGGTDIIPDGRITEDYDYLKLEGYYFDGYDDVIRLIYSIPITQGKINPDILVRTYGDTGFLEDVGYIMSGEPTQELIDIVFDAEDTNPFTYGNAKTNMTPMDSNRISEEPALETVYDVSMSGLVVSLEEVELDL